MKELMKLLAKRGQENMSDSDKMSKMQVLKELQHHMSSMMGEDMGEDAEGTIPGVDDAQPDMEQKAHGMNDISDDVMGKNPMHMEKVMVAGKSRQDLMKGLEKAQSMVDQLPEAEDASMDNDDDIGMEPDADEDDMAMMKEMIKRKSMR